MTEDNLNAQAAPENVALENSEGKTVTEDTATQTETTVETEKPAEGAQAPETVTMTKQELDDRAAKIRAIAERRAQREAGTKLAEERAKLEAQVPQQQQSYQQAQPPSPDHVWDDVLGYIHRDTTREQYSALVGQALMAQNQQQAQPQKPAQQVNQSAPQNHTPQERYGGLSSEALNQIDECSVEYSDFLATAGQIITDRMANAAAMAPDGMKMLYELQKENPLELFNMTKLSPEKQQFMVYDKLKERAAKAQKNVVTKVTPKPEPLEGGGTVNKSYADMSFAEKKALSMKKQWGD